MGWEVLTHIIPTGMEEHCYATDLTRAHRPFQESREAQVKGWLKMSLPVGDRGRTSLIFPETGGHSGL